MRPLTRKRFRVLLKDLILFYTEDGVEPEHGLILTRKEVLLVRNRDKKKYLAASYLTRHDDHVLSRGKVLVTLKDNVVEMRDAALERIAANENTKLPKTIRMSALELAKALSELPDDDDEVEDVEDSEKPDEDITTPTAPIDKFMTDVEIAGIEASNGGASLNDSDYISQDDIDEAFGGNDINDVMSAL